jgi:dienelactone hydrolase
VQTKRAALVEYIWGTSWTDVLSRQPTTLDNYVPSPGDALPSVSNLDRIEQIVVHMSAPMAAGTGAIAYTSTAYLFHPRNPNGHVVVVHHGHSCAFNGSDGEYHLDKTIQDLMASSFAVVAVRMPYMQNPAHCGSTADHDRMFSDQQRLRTGSPLQFFLEPVTQAINYIQRRYSGIYHDFNMIGLSGGGWTTTVYAAIDPRIILSFPVAGSIPLDLHDGSRDSEQRDTGFYNIAGYRDLYVLGSFGANRRQTQILNVHDDCCFTPTPQDAAAYTCQVQTTLSELGAGAFVFDYDQTSTTHQISLSALSGVILPTLQLGSLGPAPGSCSAGSDLVLAGRGVTTDQANEVLIWRSADGTTWTPPVPVKAHTAGNANDSLIHTVVPPSLVKDNGLFNLLWLEPNGDVRFAISHDTTQWLAQESALSQLPPSSGPAFAQGAGSFLALLVSGGNAVIVDLNNSSHRVVAARGVSHASIAFGNGKFVLAAVATDRSVHVFESSDGFSWHETGTALPADPRAEERWTQGGFAEGRFLLAVSTSLPGQVDIPLVRCTYLQSSDAQAWNQIGTAPCSNDATGLLPSRFDGHDLVVLNFQNRVTSVSTDFGPWHDLAGVHLNGQPSLSAAASTDVWVAGSVSTIVNQNSGKCLDIADASFADHAKIQQFHCHGGTNQRWVLGQRGEIISKLSGKCLDVVDASTADQARVQQFGCHGGANQLWRVTSAGEIVNQNSGKCLDIPSADTADQVQLQQFTCHQGLNQRWLFP